VMNEGKVTIIIAAAIAVAFWLCSMWKKGECKLESLVILVMNLVGAVTGVYIFLGAYWFGDNSAQNAIWGGITGVCMTLYTLEKVIATFRRLFSVEVLPEPSDET
jgi:hypothetical protein